MSKPVWNCVENIGYFSRSLKDKTDILCSQSPPDITLIFEAITALKGTAKRERSSAYF